MAKFAEKLILLLDHGDGVMARLHNITNFNKGKNKELFPAETERPFKYLVKKFPEVPSDFDKARLFVACV